MSRCGSSYCAFASGRRDFRTAAVTVTIPTYQRDHFLKEALDSVVHQTLTDIEIIVSDNANSGTTRKLIESYGDPRIVYAPLSENIGLHGNLTRCLHLGSAPFVAVLLDDDTMYPANLEKKLALLPAMSHGGGRPQRTGLHR